jgi:hypothetical protein
MHTHIPSERPGTGYAGLPASLAGVARYADGIGVDKSLFIPRESAGRPGVATDLIGRFLAAGIDGVFRDLPAPAVAATRGRDLAGWSVCALVTIPPLACHVSWRMLRPGRPNTEDIPKRGSGAVLVDEKGGIRNAARRLSHPSTPTADPSSQTAGGTGTGLGAILAIKAS